MININSIKTKPAFYLSLFSLFGLFITAFFSIRTNSRDVRKKQKNKPNILLIISEDNGPAISSYGAPVKTPNIDKIAKEGIRFQNAFVPQAGCSQSRAALLTGLYPHQNGQIGLATWGYHMYHKNTPNLVNDLKNAGYRTGIIGKLHINPASAFDFGFKKISGSNFQREGLERYANYASEFFKSSSRPFYLQISYPDAHRPFIPQVDGLPETVLKSSGVDPLPYMGLNSLTLRKLTANYYNSMMRLDALVGNLIFKLKSAGKYKNTLIVYIGDHGADILRGKRTSYEGGVRIPMIISWPNNGKEHAVYHNLASTLDLYPTFLAISGNSIPDYLPGKSLLPAIKGKLKSVRKYLFTEYNVHSNHNPFPQRTVRDERFKLIHNLVAGRINPGYAFTMNHFDFANIKQTIKSALEQVRKAYARMRKPPEFELFDLKNDPYEWNNLANNPKYEKVFTNLKKVLHNWQLKTKDPLIDKQKAERLFMDIMNTHAKKVNIPYQEYMDPGLFNEDRL